MEAHASSFVVMEGCDIPNEQTPMSILKQKAKRMPCVHFQNDGESQTDSESEGTTADTSCGPELDRSFEMGPGNRQPVQSVRSQRPDLEPPQNQHPPNGPEPVYFVRTQRPDMEQPQSQQALFRPELNRSFETGLGPRQPVRVIQTQRPPYEQELNRSFETGYGPRHPVRFVRSQRPTHGPELNRSFETGYGPRQPVRFVRSQRPETHSKTTTPTPTTPKPTTPSAKKEPVSSTGSEKEGDKSESLSRIKKKLNNGKDGHKQPFLARGDPSSSSRIATGLSRAPPQGRPANPSEESTWRHNVCSCSRNWEICKLI